ncbi:MAG TPA: cupin domain-containing protein [Gaiellaceae bacterium]|nr:cupin domain-containing protein [Gaiellaceae bacterium]
MVGEAHLARAESGLTPAGDGWFVVNVREAAWLTNEAFGARCVFEADVPVVRGSELEPHRFAQLGIKVAVLYRGRPSGLYHAESTQEAFLVLAGECFALVEGEERRLRAWDFLHCPPGTAHCFVGAGDEPCVLLMVGSRAGERMIVYAESELAQGHGAAVERETDSAAEAYADRPHWRPGRPAGWERLGWA